MAKKEDVRKRGDSFLNMVRKILFITVIVLGVGYGLYLLQVQNDTSSKYSNCELGDLVGDDVERLSFQNFYTDYHTEDFSKSEIEKFAQSCIEEGIKTQYQMDCCVRMKMYPDY